MSAARAGDAAAASRQAASTQLLMLRSPLEVPTPPCRRGAIMLTLRHNEGELLAGRKRLMSFSVFVRSGAYASYAALVASALSAQQRLLAFAYGPVTICNGKPAS